MTNDQYFNESVSDVDIDAEIQIVAIRTCKIKFNIDPIDPNPVLNEKQSHEKALTMSHDQMKEKSYVDQLQLTPR